ncbi:MAG: Lrp/AsnC family transcriptional regulator [Nanoarchaeota archaeon]|nr:Lrp/AsnC family transcriptional regulator [Nanoarchaeota archaeon]MBU0977342.1 Lrp/AsnC family transcriptional regulator [Nanoarchaeota archaeon]
MIKLDLKDRKLLTLLDENSRLSNSQLAKKVSLSKPAVEYRIQRLIKNKAIFSFYTMIDFTKLGYSQYKLYFKFQNTSLEDEQKIVTYWKKDSNSIWVAELRGHWDMAVSILAKNNYEFGRILSRFMEKFSKFILQKDVLLTEYSPFYSRAHLSETTKKEFTYGIPSEIIELNETDKKILKQISNNARISVVELAEKTALSRDTVMYRIKKLTNEGIIAQYKCYLNLENLNIKHYKVIFRMKNFSPVEEQKIREYTAKHKHSTQLLKLIGSYDLEIEFETQSEDELYSILNEIKQKFSSIIRDLDIIRIIKTHKLDCFPF